MSKTEITANKPLIQIYEAFKRGISSQDNTCKTLIAADVTVKGPLVHIKGRQNFMAVYKSFYQTVIKEVVHQVVEKKELVITQVSTTIKANTNQLVTLNMNEWFTIRNGKIQAVIVYFDASDLKLLDKVRYTGL